MKENIVELPLAQVLKKKEEEAEEKDEVKQEDQMNSELVDELWGFLLSEN